jgi:hypothetical protein
MTDWIAWTRCPSCGFTDKVLCPEPEGMDEATAAVRCPSCGGLARSITFPAFDVQTFDISAPGDALRDEMEDW